MFGLCGCTTDTWKNKNINLLRNIDYGKNIESIL